MIVAFEARDGARLSSLLEEHVTGTTAGIARAFIERVGTPSPAVDEAPARARKGRQPLPA
jgi:hypothetical protein